MPVEYNTHGRSQLSPSFVHLYRLPAHEYKCPFTTITINIVKYEPHMVSFHTATREKPLIHFIMVTPTVCKPPTLSVCLCSAHMSDIWKHTCTSHHIAMEALWGVQAGGQVEET